MLFRQQKTESVGKMTHVDPRVRRTRQWIQEALMALLAKREFNDITVQEIAARAGVNRATFYAHFEDKYALLDITIQEAFQKAIDQQLGMTSALTTDNLRSLLIVTYEFLRQFSKNCHPIRANSQPPLEIAAQRRLFTILTQWLQQEGQQDAAAKAMVVSWAIFGSAFQWSRETQNQSSTQFADQMLPFVLMGLQSTSQAS